MEILRSVLLYTENRDMPFLLIGGHAINAYGISRQTGDIDLLVQRSAKDKWLELMARLHYQSGQSDDRFARFKPNVLAAWPIDLMFVDDVTFSKMFSESRDLDFGLVTVKVASPKHLIILKIHSLKHYQEHRFPKDYSDLIALIKKGGLELSNNELKSLCEKYASQDLFFRIMEDLDRI